MKNLQEMVTDPNMYQSVLRDSARVLDEEVGKKSGITGMAIKAAYKLLKSIKQGQALQKVLEVLMPEFINKLEPHFERYQAEGQGKSWSEFISPHYDTLADDFLAVTDTKASASDSAKVRKTYEKLRPKARKEVVASMPALAKMMEKYIH
jgi:hypothetical protein